MKIRMVLTSHDRLGDTGRKTSLWLEEFAAPYFVFRNHNPDSIALSDSFCSSGKPVAERIGGIYEKAADWAPFAVVDGRVMTGQTPASSTAAARALLQLLAAQKAA